MPSSRGPAAVAVAAFEGMELIEARGSIDNLDLFNSGCVCGWDRISVRGGAIDRLGRGWGVAHGPLRSPTGVATQSEVGDIGWRALWREGRRAGVRSSPQPQRPSWVDAKGGQPTDPMAWPLDRTTTVHMRAMRWTRPGMACVVNRKHSLNESIIPDN